MHGVMWWLLVGWWYWPIKVCLMPLYLPFVWAHRAYVARRHPA